MFVLTKPLQSLLHETSNSSVIDLNTSKETVNINKKVENQSIPIFLHLLNLPISSQLTIGLAKIFDFEILTHGTTFKNCYGILKNGADPSKGGSEIGSTIVSAQGDSNNQAVKDAHNFFYVFKDTEATKTRYSESTTNIYNSDGTVTKIIEFEDREGNTFKEQQYRGLDFTEKPGFHLLPKFHAILAAIGPNVKTENKVKKNAEIIFKGAFTFLFSPTLRFMYTLDETKAIFEDDPDYGGYAYRTPTNLPNNRIGLIGVCKHANIEGFKRGLRTRPMRVTTGVVQLIAGSILTCTGLGLIF